MLKTIIVQSKRVGNLDVDLPTAQLAKRGVRAAFLATLLEQQSLPQLLLQGLHAFQAFACHMLKRSRSSWKQKTSIPGQSKPKNNVLLVFL